MISTPKDLVHLLANNEIWAKDVLKDDPDFFVNGAEKQEPKVLWIGCADSRVPETVTVSKPGDIFVHRNIANQFHAEDDSAQAVLTYAVEHLHVEHIIVVGHTRCGGVKAAHDAARAAAQTKQDQADDAPLTRWLAPLVKLAAQQGDFQPGENPSNDVLTNLSEANVCAQVDHIVASNVIQTSWAASFDLETQDKPKPKPVHVHGWIYDLEIGLLRDLGVSRGPELVGRWGCSESDIISIISEERLYA